MRDPRTVRPRHLRAVRRQIVPSKRRRRRRPWRAFLVAGLLLGAVLGAGALRSWLNAEAAPAVVELTSGTVEVAYDLDAVVVRKELVVRAPAGGSVKRIAADGERVRVGAPVVEIVRTAPSAEADKSGGASAGPERAHGGSDTPAAGADPSTAGDGEATADHEAIKREIDALSEQIYELAVAVHVARDRGDAAEMERLQAELNQLALRQAELAHRLGAAVHEGVPAPAQESDSPAASPEGPTGSESRTRVTAAMAGVLVYQIDGMEEALNPDGQEAWDPGWFRSLPLPDPQRTGSGHVDEGQPLFKVVDNLSLSVLGVVPEEALQELPVDGRAELFLEGHDGAFTVRVAVLGQEGGEALLQLSAPLLPEELTAVRKVRGRLVLGRYEGLIAPRTALDVRDGQQGIWVEQADGQPAFRAARVLGGNRDLVALETEVPPGTRILRVAPRTMLEPAGD